MMSEPTRLLDDPALSEGLRADLAQAQSVVLEGFDVSAGAAGLKAAIAAETTGAGAGAAGFSKILGLGLAGAVTASALAWFALRAPESGPVQGEAVDPVVSSVPPVSSVAAIPVPETAELAPPSPQPEVAAVPSLPEPEMTAPVRISEPEAQPLEDAAPAARKRPRKPETQGDLLREAKLISDARVALKTDAARALKLLDDARSEFPRGLLGEEREALTVLSLHKLGRFAQAKASAERFLEKHARGPYAGAVRQVLD